MRRDLESMQLDQGVQMKHPRSFRSKDGIIDDESGGAFWRTVDVPSQLRDP